MNITTMEPSLPLFCKGNLFFSLPGSIREFKGFRQIRGLPDISRDRCHTGNEKENEHGLFSSRISVQEIGTEGKFEILWGSL